VKRSLLVEAAGGPLAVVIAGANVHDTKLLAATLDAIVVARPQPTPERPQHLCLDLGYDNPTGAEAVKNHHYVAHLRRIGKEKLDLATGKPRFPARRWVVERTLRGWPRVGRCSSATTNTRRTSWRCSSSPAPCSGSVASFACPC